MLQNFIWSTYFSRGIFFLAQPSQIIGYLGQISSWALIFLKWNGSLQYLQLSVLSGHSRSLCRSCSLKRIRSLQEGQGMTIYSHFPSWVSSYSLILPFQMQFSLTQTADKLSTSLRTALSGKAHPCLRIDVDSSKISSFMHALHFCGPLLTVLLKQ